VTNIVQVQVLSWAPPSLSSSLMTIGNLNPTEEIGASAWHIDLDGHRILLDSGIHPKIDGAPSLPLFELIAKEDLDSIAITHCHHDHCGALPVAAKYFPQAHLLMSELSYYLLPRILHNSVNVMKKQAAEKNIPEYPLYTHEDVDLLKPRFQGFKYNREVEWISFQKTRLGIPSPTLELFDAGHTLGSAGVLIKSNNGKSLFYTGDCCLHDQTLLRRAHFKNVKADILIMETTRGDHNSNPSHVYERRRFANSLVKAQREKRSIMIPVFALGRTQEVLAEIALLMQEGRIPPQTIFVGGLGKTFTEIYDRLSHHTNRSHKDLHFSEALSLQVLEPSAIQRIKLSKSRIFVITAGMMSESTPAHDLALRFMSEVEHTIFFVGYADPDSPAGRLKVADKGTPFFFSDHVQEAICRCDREHFDLTAHAYRKELLELVRQISPKTVILAHGSTPSKDWFAQQIQTNHPEIQTIDIKSGEFVTL
jgi:Cft2 family RNA processing exonuclease